MRISSRFLASVLIFVCPLFAKADTLDPSIRVLDPAPSPTYVPTVILSAPFSFTFSTCAPGELPAGDTADGCFAGQNGTGMAWGGVQLIVPDQAGVVGTTFSCDLSANGNIYSNASCPPNPVGGTFITTFTGGSTINPGEDFFITETGVDPSTFPVTMAVVTSPEPSSWLLFATGLLGMGFYKRSTSHA